MRVSWKPSAFSKNALQYWDGRAQSDCFGYAVNGCTQKSFVADDVQIFFSPFLRQFCCRSSWDPMQKPVFFIELVVVTVVGDGEDVENSANLAGMRGFGFPRRC